MTINFSILSFRVRLRDKVAEAVQQFDTVHQLGFLWEVCGQTMMASVVEKNGLDSSGVVYGQLTWDLLPLFE